MNNSRLILLALIVGTCLHAECLPGGLAVVVPKSNPTDNISMAQLRKLVMGDAHTWPDKNKVLLVTVDADGPAFKCMLAEAVRMTMPEYRKYLLNAEFRGDEPLPMKTVEPANAVRMVAASTGSFLVIGASSLNAVAGGVKILSINGKQPGEPGYPL